MHWLTERDLPEIMRPDEEKKWLLKLGREEDEKAREMLIMHNLRLVVWIADKYDAGNERDDLMSVGTIGLIKAVDSFDPGFRCRVSTYASYCIENELRMYIRKKRKVQETEICTGLGNMTEDRIPDIFSGEWQGEDGRKTKGCKTASHGDPVGDQVVSRIVMEELKSAMEQLPPGDRTLLELRYGLACRGSYKDSWSQEELARRSGISQSCLSRKMKRILVKLRNNMSGK